MTLKKIINLVVSVFVFVVMLDPADNIFRLKMPLFLLLFFLCIINYKSIFAGSDKIILTIYSVLLLTNLIGFLRGVSTDWQFGIGIYKGFLMMLLIPWATRIRILEKLILPTIIISIIVITTYIGMMLFPEIESFIYSLTRNEESGLPILMSRRTFIGFNVTSVFYKTSPLSLFVAGTFLFRLFNNIGSWKKNMIISILSTSILFFAGTRMNMLCVTALIGFVVVQRLWNYRFGKLFSILFLFIGIISAIILGYFLLQDKGEESLDVKTKLSEAFYLQVKKDPWLLLWGQGPGATFDSLGVRGTEAVQSELTYQDMIRWFGIPLMLVILIIYVYPIVIIFIKRKRLKYSAVIIFSYILYLIIAGTNPLLITSTGMLALLTMYTYAYNPHYEYRNLLR